MNKLIKISEEQIVTVQAVTNITTVTATTDNNIESFEIHGISIIPLLIEIKPNDIRNSIISKEKAEGGIIEIEKLTKEGIYFVNIKDYSSDEIQFLSQRITDKFLSEIWTLLTAIKTNPFTISLSDEKVKELILKENSDIFKNENEFKTFCSKYGLTIKSFIVPAKFSELDIKLKEIDARFDLEQFFARRYLFCSTLINKLNKRISDYVSNGNVIDDTRLKMVYHWIETLKQKLDVLKNFKDYYKLYDMPKLEKNINIKDSHNINIIGENMNDSKIKQEPKIKEETTGRTFWDFINKHPFITIGIVLIFIALLFYGFLEIKFDNGAVIIKANSKKNEHVISTEKQDDAEKWLGNWKIGWRYDKYFDNPELFVQERDLEFKIVDGKLIGEYLSYYGNKEVKTQLYDFEITANRIVGKYKGIFTIDKKSYESGQIEFLMFQGNRYFIGKYKRTKPNTYTVDGNHRLWYGRK